MKEFENISIRGRMAYLLCLFERTLTFYKYEKDDWNWILDKLWQYTSIQYIDDWMYEIAEYLPENILEDEEYSFEYITKEEYQRLYRIYKKTNEVVRQLMTLIFEVGTMELYSRLMNHSYNTLNKMQEITNILNENEIHTIDTTLFKKYEYSVNNGWGECFNGKQLSIYLS